MGALKNHMHAVAGRTILLAFGLAACSFKPPGPPPPRDAGPGGPQCAVVPEGGFPLDGGIVVTTVKTNIPVLGSSLAMDGQGDLFAADVLFWTLVVLRPSGLAAYLCDDQPLLPGQTEPDGWPDAGVIPLESPSGVAVAADGALIVTGFDQDQIFKIETSGTWSVLAGSGKAGYLDGPSGEAEFDSPSGVVIDDGGSIYVADNGARIRKIDPQGNVTTFAGGSTPGYADGQGLNARFSGLANLAIDRQGLIYGGDVQNNRIRVIDLNANVTTLAPDAGFAIPWAAAPDNAGNVFVADTGANEIRRVDSSGNVTTIAGDGTPCDTDGTGGPTGTAQLIGPESIVVAPNGDIYASEVANSLRLIHFAQ